MREGALLLPVCFTDPSVTGLAGENSSLMISGKSCFVPLSSEILWNVLTGPSQIM